MPVWARIGDSSRSLRRVRAAPSLVAVADLDAVDPDAALVVELEQVDAAQQRGLAAARGADDRHHLAAPDVEVDALQHAVVAERLADPADADDDGVGRGHSRM